MAILFMEGFDGYADIDTMLADPRIGTDAVPSQYALQTGRSGSGQSVELTAGIDYIACSLSQTSDSTIWVQFALYFEANLAYNDQRICQIRSPDGTLHGTLIMNFGSQTLSYMRVDYNGTVLGTSSVVLSNWTWYYIELKVVIDNSAGTVLLKVDGVEEINLTSQDTQNGSTAEISSVRFGSGVSGTDAGLDPRFDDIVIGDGSGTDATDLLGECAIELLSPDGAGNYAQWTPSAGSNYQNVDEAPSSSDGDTTYNSSSTAAQKDTFTTGNLVVTSGNVRAVQVGYIARREDGGGRTIRSMIRTSSTDASGTSVYTPSSYIHRHDIFENDAGGTDWTISSVNAMEIGYELVT